MSRPAHILTLVAPSQACVAATARYTLGNPPRRSGHPEPAGLFFGAVESLSAIDAYVISDIGCEL